MSKRTKFTPTPGEIYKNQGGGSFKCLRTVGFIMDHDAVMQNTASGWTFTAHGCGMYDNGTMDWDYSSGGQFEELDCSPSWYTDKKEVTSW